METTFGASKICPRGSNLTCCPKRSPSISTKFCLNVYCEDSQMTIGKCSYIYTLKKKKTEQC